MEYEIRPIQIIPLEEIRELPDQNNFVNKISGELNAAFLFSQLNEFQREIVEDKMAGYLISEIGYYHNRTANQIIWELNKIRRIIKKVI